MRKNSFLEGAMITTIGIIICKIIGLLYVIPFKNIIGEQGGALYGYAYSIYTIFLSLSASGIPVAMSKVISEYNSLGYYYIKERAYKIGSSIIIAVGFISFLILMIFAPFIAQIILGDLEGGNTVAGVTLVIRAVSTALLIVPLLSVTKGYLQGHRFMQASSISSVVEQLVRVAVIILGSFIALRIFNLSLETAVGIAVFGATVGAFVAYFYLVHKIRKNKESLNKDEPITRAEAKITKEAIAKKIIYYAIPFIIIELVKSAFSLIDTLTVVNTMVSLGLSNIAENTIGVLNVWASKLNMIVISITIGITISLIPNLASSFTKKDMEDVSHKINQSLQLMLFISLPMTVGLSFLASSVWTVFYGYDAFSINMFQIYVFLAITFSLYSILIDSAQTLNNTKLALGTLIGSFVSKLILNIPMMYLFDYLKIGAQYAPIVTNFLIHITAITVLLYSINKKYSIDYSKTFYNAMRIILCSAIMFMSLKIFSLFFPIDAVTKGEAFIEIIIYSLISMSVYFIAVIKSGTLDNILGNKALQRVMDMVKNKVK
ncbi:MAG: polysaccharide biosynthesis protein [Mollicutes bacterium]|nr:polysaccharide biosynthesis protein [Mollicutes bacterium]